MGAFLYLKHLQFKSCSTNKRFGPQRFCTEAQTNDQPVAALAFVTLIDYLSGFLAAATQHSYTTEAGQQEGHNCHAGNTSVS